VKCQGIKTKLVPFIFRHIEWSQERFGRWIEPFVGSGVVALNLAPQRAVLADSNPHVINIYRGIQHGDVNSDLVREFLGEEGKKLSSKGADYYEVRARFNNSGSPLDFLFLNRSCFNGIMRFNRRGKFNVPFCHKPQRFSKAYITKIANQVNWAAKQMADKEIDWRVADWKMTLAEARPQDFVYMDPPYIGRHADYYNSWDNDAAPLLASAARKLPCGFAVSMWLENAYRRNSHIEHCWSGMDVAEFAHFYHVGPRESLRNKITEALIIKPGFAQLDYTETDSNRGISMQGSLFESSAHYS
jgi:DNA adenine methylase